ncbi:alkaline ceramidase 1 isoform X2 [Cavia porcellus]|uniref:alkaline ceramidase 1 isoform X2 n=1 Tax=Cavia porcellus TaxID=10141 RepID=UPI002FE3BDBA
MRSIVGYQSSEVDWCESNFLHSPVVAEFYNTQCDLPDLRAAHGLPDALLRPQALPLHLQRPDALRAHSFLGQLLDEVAILWMLSSCYSIWMPRCYFPSFLRGSRFQFTRMMLWGTTIVTFLSVVRPILNAYALNSIAIHVLYIVCSEYRKTTNRQLRHIIHVSTILWASAVISWVSDRLFCSFWQRIHFFYLHSIWHVIISITFPYGFVTMALVDATYEMPGETLKVRYWPRDSWPVGLPYIEIQADDKNC